MTHRERWPESTGESVKLRTDDGVILSARLYQPAGEADMTVLVLPGVGVPQRALRHLAGWISRQGARCVTLDYRGIGESPPSSVPGANRLTAWARYDAVAALRWIEEQWAEPVVLLAHSFGGQMLGLSPELHRVRATVMIGSQLGSTRYWDGPRRLLLVAYWWMILPLASLMFDPIPGWTGIGVPLPRDAAREWARWGRSAGWFLDHEPEGNRLLGSFDKPLAMFGISDDTIAPPRAVDALADRFTAAEPVRRTIRPGDLGLESLGHTGLFRPGATEPVWREMLDFLAQSLATGPRA